MPTIIWSNGVRDTARTWGELLDLVRQTQWAQPLTDGEFRELLARRATVWSGATFNFAGTPARTIFADLEWAKLIVIESADEAEKGTK